MNARQLRIVEILHTGPETAAAIASAISLLEEGDSLITVPEASIRRNIQELRALGYNISFAGPSSGLYRLLENGHYAGGQQEATA